MMKKAIHPAEVDEAISTIADYCKRLKAHYEVELTFTSEECCLTINDPDGDQIYLDTEQSRAMFWPLRGPNE